MEIDKSKPVLVTGATGYVAGWVVKRLLDEGLTVHCAVRDPSNPDKVKHLDELAAKSPGSIKYFKADLLDAGSYTEGMQGCSVVFHTASPYLLGVKDPQKDLVDPALLGTRNVLESVNKVESVRRVVLTSSCAAIYTDNTEIENMPAKALNEEVWNETASLEYQPYYYSKTVAEKEAWKMAGEQDRWDLVAINPSVVVGPGINPRGTSESFSIVKQMGNGMMAMGAPRLGFGAVDVRDVAEAHVRAAFMPNAKGRYVTSAHNTNLLEMAQTLRERYSRYPLPKKALPKWLVWLVGPITNKALNRRMIARNVDVPFRADNSKSKRELGMEYRPLAESMNDFFQQLIDSGQLKKR